MSWLMDQAMRSNPPYIEDRSLDTPLHEAIDRLDCLKNLLEHGMPVDAKGTKSRTALHWALIKENWPSVCMLVQYAADVDVRLLEDDPDRGLKVGMTPLHLAAISGCYKSMQLLVMCDADATIQDRLGNTPLHYAIKLQSVSKPFRFLPFYRQPEVHQCIKILVEEAGADLTMKNNKTKTPLSIAIIINNKLAVNYLLKRGGRSLLQSEYLLSLARPKAADTTETAVVPVAQQTSTTAKKATQKALAPGNTKKNSRKDGDQK